MQKSTGNSKKLEPVVLIFTLNISNVVFPPKHGAFGVQDNGWHHTGEIRPKNSQKSGGNRQFQAKMPKSIHRNISRTIIHSNWRFEDRVQTTKHTTWVVHYYPEANSAWLTAAILKIDLTSFSRSGWYDLDDILQTGAEWPSDYDDVVEIETKSIIPIWLTFVFQNRK